MRLDHLNLYVNDITLSRTFYETVLLPFGYKVVREFGDVASIRLFYTLSSLLYSKVRG